MVGNSWAVLWELPRTRVKVATFYGNDAVKYNLVIKLTDLSCILTFMGSIGFDKNKQKKRLVVTIQMVGIDRTIGLLVIQVFEVIGLDREEITLKEPDAIRKEV